MTLSNSFPYSSDLSIISGEITQIGTTTYNVFYHLPIIPFVILYSLILFVFARLILEFIIRIRRAK